MPQMDPPLPEVYSAQDVARALGAPLDRIRALFASGKVRTLDPHSGAQFVTMDEAMRVMRAVVSGVPLEAPGLPVGAGMPHFALPADGRREALLPFAVSGSVHAVICGLLVAIALLGVRQARVQPAKFDEIPARLVFLATPGPGGGGGGGGLRERTPATRAERKGDRSLSSPMPDPPPAPPEPVQPPKPTPQPPPEPPVEAPVATMKNDPRERSGVLEEAPPQPAPVPSQGSGVGGGAGTGQGTGLGSGNGVGVGEGTQAGMGGGPYRPGSGVEPPTLLREVKPDYTEDARRRGVEGEVVMEIVVRRDGSVGEARVTRGLGSGLDQRALEAVRQWRFGPAMRLGQAVDVLVEVSMEFRLR